MKAWPGDLPVGMLGDLQAMFSLVTGRGELTFHIWILVPSELYIAKLNPTSSLHYLNTVYQNMNLYILTDISVSVSCLHEFPEQRPDGH